MDRVRVKRILRSARAVRLQSTVNTHGAFDRVPVDASPLSFTEPVAEVPISL